RHGNPATHRAATRSGRPVSWKTELTPDLRRKPHNGLTMRLLIATTNREKIREIRSLLAGAPAELITLADLAPVAEPEETGDTFEDNARLKARYYEKHSGGLTGAQDSGLVIDALNGEPGVKSARFLRPDAAYPERFAAIFERLARHPDRPRTARFVCALSVVQGDAIAFETTETVEGVIGQ